MKLQHLFETNQKHLDLIKVACEDILHRNSSISEGSDPALDLAYAIELIKKEFKTPASNATHAIMMTSNLDVLTSTKLDDINESFERLKGIQDCSIMKDPAMLAQLKALKALMAAQKVFVARMENVDNFCSILTSLNEIAIGNHKHNLTDEEDHEFHKDQASKIMIALGIDPSDYSNY